MIPSGSLRSTTSLWRTLLFVHLAALAVLAVIVWRQLQPVPMHDLRLDAGERLKCLSYAPFRLPGQTPLDPAMHISREQIAEDLAALARITECVRLYSVSQGQDQVPAVAREVGLKVLLGAWIGADPLRNAAELDRAIEVANANTDVVRALIVGNEVLLRREQTEAQLHALLESARTRAQVPITYADVWEFWTRHTALADKVDFITVHILPFWEDHPVDIDTALEHVAAVREEVGKVFTKPILIGETGWPSAGRQREDSQPSLVNQARYVREFIHQAHARGWDYNLIEAVDQPWKRLQEGTVGGYWGILDTQLAPKFPLAGPVAERHSALAPFAGAAAGALITLLATLGFAPRPTRARALATVGAGAVAGLVAVLHWEHALVAYRNLGEWLVLGGVAATGLLLPLLLARWSGDTTIPTLVQAWQRIRKSPAAIGDATIAFGLARGLLLFAAAVAALLLFADPRYRDFPTLLYLVPAAIFAALAVSQRLGNGLEERLCAVVIGACGIARWIVEPANPQAVGWLVVTLALALAALGRPARQQEQ